MHSDYYHVWGIFAQWNEKCFFSFAYVVRIGSYVCLHTNSLLQCVLNTFHEAERRLDRFKAWWTQCIRSKCCLRLPDILPVWHNEEREVVSVYIYNLLDIHTQCMPGRTDVPDLCISLLFKYNVNSNAYFNSLHRSNLFLVHYTTSVCSPHLSAIPSFLSLFLALSLTSFLACFKTLQPSCWCQAKATVKTKLLTI